MFRSHSCSSLLHRIASDHAAWMSKQFFDARRRGLGFLRCDFERGFNRRLVDIAARTFEHPKLTHLHIHTNDRGSLHCTGRWYTDALFSVSCFEADGARGPLVCRIAAARPAAWSLRRTFVTPMDSATTDVAEETSQEISIVHMGMTCRSADERLWLA